MLITAAFLNRLSVEGINSSMRVLVVEVTRVASFINCSSSLAVANCSNLSICLEVILERLSMTFTANGKRQTAT